MGKPLDQSVGEVEFSAAIYEYYADNAEKFLADEPIDLLDGEGSALIRRSSVGVLLGHHAVELSRTTRWPASQARTWSLGNTIVLKHAPQCPESAAALQQIFDDAGFPEGAYVNVYATNEQIAEAIADPRVPGRVADRLGAGGCRRRRDRRPQPQEGGPRTRRLRSVHRAQSSDDLDATVDAAVDGRFENTGQACNAAKRIIVAEAVYDDFLDKFTKKVREKADGLAPLSSVAAAERLDDQVKRAVADGATLVSEGERKGAFFPPGVLTDVSPDSPSYREELFGPVATVYKVRRRGRRPSNWPTTPRSDWVRTSSPPTTTRPSASRTSIEAGMVFVNAVGAEGVELPFGGVKRSGFGRELGRFGIDEFVNKKLIRIG